MRPTALAPYRGGFLILCHIGGELVAVDPNGKEIQRFGKGLLRDPNDGYADPMGGVYFSDPGLFSKDTQRGPGLSADAGWKPGAR
ncbi:MAG: hypothetical protein WDN76_10620 [Alphaproteobacteria bacterium]